MELGAGKVWCWCRLCDGNSQPIVSHTCFRRPEASKRMASEDSNGLARLSRGRSQTVATTIVIPSPVGEKIWKSGVELFVISHEDGICTISVSDNSTFLFSRVDDAISECEERADPPAILLVSPSKAEVGEEVTHTLQAETQDPRPFSSEADSVLNQAS